MLRSVKFTRLFAILALLAWSNVQAMACCWAMPEKASAAHSSSKPEAATSMAEDHSCCPGEEPHASTETPTGKSTPQTSNEDCSPSEHGETALCCTHTEPAEITNFVPQFSFVQLALVAYLLPFLPEKAPDAVPASPPLASSGPPRYLALERILI